MAGALSLLLRPEHCDPLFLYRELKGAYRCSALLESADRAHGINDLSFIALGARDTIKVSPGQNDPLGAFDGLITQKRTAGLLKTGYIGFVSFEAARHFDAVNLPPDPAVPDALFFLPEILLRIDHRAKTVSITTQPDTKEDIEHLKAVIESSPFLDDRPEKAATPAPIFSAADVDALRRTSKETYMANVQRAQERILAGEAFQIVLSQEFRFTSDATPLEVYAKLREINPSPYMYCFETPEISLVGASPETLIRVDGETMFYRPIAGTRKRTGQAEIDKKMQAELLSDEKERAEHQMLVDLGRNDIGRIAEIGSVNVKNPFRIEQYAHVYHLVSDIEGTLRKDLSSLDALRSVFPAGTLTGAPKLRAMEILRELEGGPRGVYGGAFGYVDLEGNLDMAITIRTLVFQHGEISLRTGAGIVRDSVPEHEDSECLHKARSCLSAVYAASQTPPLPCAR